MTRAVLALVPLALLDGALISEVAAQDLENQSLARLVAEIAEPEPREATRDIDKLDRSLVNEAAKTTFEWQEYFSARLSEADLRIDVAKAETATIRHTVDSDRKIESAELTLQIATRDRDRYAEGESDRERMSLENRVELARARHRQLEDRLAWSERLANGGLISQAALEIDASAVKGSESELSAAEDRLTVFETIDLERYQTQLETDVLAAQAELELLRQNAASRSEQLESNSSAARQNLNAVRARVAELNEMSVVNPPFVATDKVELSGQRKAVQLARSAMVQAEQKLTAVKKQADVAALNGQRMQKVQELQLKAFRKGRLSGTLHELSREIRILSEQLAADEQQLAWSRRVIRKGYITAAELRSVELTVNRRKAEVENIRKQKSILSEHTLERDEFELTEKVRHSSNELERQKRFANAQIEELKVIADAKREIWEIHQEKLSHLNGQPNQAVAEAGGR